LASNMLELLYVHQEGAEVYYNCSKMHASLPGHTETRVACIFQAKITPPFARLNFLLKGQCPAKTKLVKKTIGKLGIGLNRVPGHYLVSLVYTISHL
jgi:hypothetical protein